MDESMRILEERLEGLVPKGISDHGRQSLESMVEELAEETVGLDSGGGAWKWGIGVAAALGLVAGTQLMRDPVAETVRVHPAKSRVVDVSIEEELLPAIETMAISRRVEGRADEGWVQAEGVPHVYRYWGYDVTDEEDVLDEETGYMVTVYSQREERIPVRMTSL